MIFAKAKKKKCGYGGGRWMKSKHNLTKLEKFLPLNAATSPLSVCDEIEYCNLRTTEWHLEDLVVFFSEEIF